MHLSPFAALIILALVPQARSADSGAKAADRLTPPPPAARVAPPPPAVRPAPAEKKTDFTCVKKQLADVYEYEKKFYEKNQKYSGSLEEMGVPKAVIDDCPGWDPPVPRTSYGGSGFTVKSANPTTGESWSVNNEKSYIQETMGHVQ